MYNKASLSQENLINHFNPVINEYSGLKCVTLQKSIK